MKKSLRKKSVQVRCPNCRSLFVKKQKGMYFCSICGWFEKVGKEWQNRGEPEPVSPVAPQSRDIAGKYAKCSPEPEPEIRKILGGLVTITEVDESEGEHR